MLSSAGRKAGVNAQLVRWPEYSRTWNRLLMAAIAPRLHPVRWAMSKSDMSVDANRLTILRISDSCKAHPCLATSASCFDRVVFSPSLGSRTMVRLAADCSNGTQVLGLSPLAGRRWHFWGI